MAVTVIALAGYAGIGTLRWSWNRNAPLKLISELPWSWNWNAPLEMELERSVGVGTGTPAGDGTGTLPWSWNWNALLELELERPLVLEGLKDLFDTSIVRSEAKGYECQKQRQQGLKDRRITLVMGRNTSYAYLYLDISCTWDDNIHGASGGLSSFFTPAMKGRRLGRGLWIC